MNGWGCEVVTMIKTGDVRPHCLNCSDYMVDCSGCIVGQHNCNRPYHLCKDQDMEAAQCSV